MKTSLSIRCCAAAGLLVLTATGCRGNLGSAFAVATGRADIARLTGETPTRAGSNTEAVNQAPVSQAPVNQASFAPPTSAGLFEAVDPATNNPAAPPSRDEAFAAVLPQLQELAATNPAAQKRLLEQMQSADPAHWPLLIQRLRADLAVHQQLNEDTGDAATPAGHQEAASPAMPDQASTKRAVDAMPAPSAPTPTFAVQQASHTTTATRVAAAFDPPPLRPATATAPPTPATPSALPTSAAPTSATPLAAASTTAAPTNTAPRPLPKVTAPMAKLVSAQGVDQHHRRVTPAIINNPMAADAMAADAPSPSRLAWRDALQQAITDLNQHAPTQPQSAGEAYQHARLRLLQLASGDVEGASAAIPGLSSTEQSYWSHQLFAIAKLMDDRTQPETKRRAAAANLHLARAAAELSQLSSLAVRSLTFCKQVYGYGAYEAVSDTTFQPGEAITLYAEVQHYKSVTTDEGRHTALASSFRLVNNAGETVDSGDFPVVEDYCLSDRRDFHIQYTVPLPDTAPAGAYRLELTIEDQLGHKRGHASADLTLAGGPG